MFKKPPQPKALANIKSSDRKKLLAFICELYHIPRDKLTKEQEYQLLPAVVKQASFKSIQNYQGTIYYDSNETPIYFRSRDSQVYPTVYTAWKNGYLLPLVVTHELVIDHIKNGADLMLPGCLLPFDKRITKNMIVGIIDYKQPGVVIAIGIANLDLGRYETLGQGIAVRLLHVIGDELFKLNTLVDIDQPKLVDTTYPPPAITEPSAISSEADVPQVTELMEDMNLQSSKDDQPQTSDNQDIDDMDDLAEQVTTLTTEEIDNFFIRSLLQCIKLDNIDLPISSSNFMSNHVLKNFPVIDSKYKNIKKTSFKKTGKFLKNMVKLGYLQVKGKDDDLTITSLIAKTDPKIQGFNTHKVGKSKVGDNGNSKDKKETLKVVQLYQPTNKYRMFFNKLNEEYNMPYTLSEIKNLINKYIKQYSLGHEKDPKKIKVDAELADILSVNEINRNEVLNKFLKYMSLKYVILKPDQSIDDDNLKIYNGETPKIQIICETKIGRKTVTRVKNFEKFMIKPHIIEEDLRNLCQGSSTLEKINEKADYEVLVQGPHYKLINEYLISKGVPGNCINYEDKSKRKKRS